MAKKRKLSPSASSRSSATPGPSTAPTSALPEVQHGSPSTVSVGLDEGSLARSSIPPAPIYTERAVARHGVIQPGSGDGQDCGDECFLWNDLPMNKHGFRYAACAASPIVSPSPLYPFYRILTPAPPCPPVHLSWVDRSPFLRLSADASTCTTDRGFRAGRANMAVREGKWYFECHILRGQTTGAGGGTGGDVGNAHVRVGWGRREAQMDAPVGADAYSYGIRDVDGSKVHISRPKPYAQGFGTGDVVGCMITLPPYPNKPALLARHRVPIRYKGQHYFEMDDIPPNKEMEALVDREGKVAAAARAAAAEAETPTLPRGKGKKAKAKPKPVPVEAPMRDLPILPGSRIDFFVNGQAVEEAAFTDIYDFAPLPLQNPKRSDKQPIDDGTIGYYPMISCFGRGKAKLVCGPDFAFPPTSDARGMHERVPEQMAEEAVLDEADELDLSIRFRAEIEEERIRRERVDKRLAAQTAKKAAKAEARVKARVSETPVPMIPSGLAYEVKPDDYEVKVEAASQPPTTPASPIPLSEQGAESPSSRPQSPGDADAEGSDEEEGIQWG